MICNYCLSRWQEMPKRNSTAGFVHPLWQPFQVQSFSIFVASVLVQGGTATNAVDRPLRYNQRRSWLPIIVFCTKNMGYFLVVRSP